jgi:alkaline phosphatase
VSDRIDIPDTSSSLHAHIVVEKMSRRRRWVTLTFILATRLITVPAHAQQSRARNVIIFFGDGMGLSSVNAASILGYAKAQALFLQHMPHLALADTSSAAQWVTDAGAAATAMATGRKTENRRLSTFPPESDGTRSEAKTILDYAEERGLSTGLISDDNIVNPLVSAFYARTDDRNKTADVFLQLLTPRFGDGVDVVVGPGRKAVLDALGPEAQDLSAAFAARHTRLSDTLSDIDGSTSRRAVVLLADVRFDLAGTVGKVAASLAMNPKGFFLAVHSDCHLKDIERSLRCVLALDKIVQATTERYGRDTLILVTADHGYALHIEGQRVSKDANVLSQIVLADEHTGEEVPVFATGPGSERVRGFVPNTAVFEWMMQAFGWTKS